MSARLRAAVLAVALLPAGCNWYYDRVPSPDDLVKLVPWFDHMIRSPAVHPYQRSDLPRLTVPGTVPITGGEGDWRAEWQGGNATTADRLINPTDPAATLAVGDTLFGVYCAPCHGARGAGDGLVGRRIGAPSLQSERARALSDGGLYSMLRYGRGVMPGYGDKITRPERRWAVVNYVRRLQADAAPTAAGAGR